MELPKNIQHQIAQFQQAQQQAQAITMQKQSVDMQIKETEKALEELKKVEGETEVYKTAGNLLIKVNQDEVTVELEDKIETLKLREKTVKRQEERIMAKLQEMQTTIQEAMQGSDALSGGKPAPCHTTRGFHRRCDPLTSWKSAGGASGDCPNFRVNENGTVPFDATLLDGLSQLDVEHAVGTQTAEFPGHRRSRR